MDLHKKLRRVGAEFSEDLGNCQRREKYLGADGNSERGCTRSSEVFKHKRIAERGKYSKREGGGQY